MSKVLRQTMAAVDKLIEQITVDANGEDEQLGAFHNAFDQAVKLPCDALVVGEPVSVLRIDYDGNERRGLTALCRRRDGGEHTLSVADVVFPLDSEAAVYVAAYRRWMGLPPFRRPLEMVVISAKHQTGTCRLLGSAATQTLRARRHWVPGEILVITSEKPLGILSSRIDAAALKLVPLLLHHRGTFDRAEAFEFEQVLPGWDPEDPFSDPIGRSNDRRDEGDTAGAVQILMDVCEADLRCLDAHAHLGNMVFLSAPAEAIRHYEVGLRIGELSLPSKFKGVLPWGMIDNRPFLRCMHGYALCLWRLGEFKEATRVYKRMLALNPMDNQGARFVLPELRAKVRWEDSSEA